MHKEQILYKLQVQAAMAALPPCVMDILAALAERLHLDDAAKQKLGEIDGVAYSAQLINWLAKTENEGFYKFKNMLTRWLACNHPGAYFDGGQILYIPVDNDKQLSFHVHHDTEARDIYQNTAGRPIEWDGVKRQPLAEIYLLNHLGAGNECSHKKELENEAAVQYAA